MYVENYLDIYHIAQGSQTKLEESHMVILPNLNVECDDSIL